ncbi:putative heterokaryon incompatibility protein [Botrytis fragariae]|uniref:Putative heterokaryon incompatibility protein n=1 Tax=Botrytis fragariae TaxID=1964551 RepID=A0A8H6ANB7_9HELO|nr:putative heterokaryon incompatibility protein [Botrytis fragariae]KAF5870514.1 putative heterokaryon incompatibility protein [Botrytis fragariae]
MCPKNGKAKLVFPTRNYHPGGTSDEHRLVTPSLLPELSDECIFCCKIKTELSNAFRKSDSWQLSVEQTSSQVQYVCLEKLELTLPRASYESKRVRFYVAVSSLDLCLEWPRIKKIPPEGESSFTKRKTTIVKD